MMPGDDITAPANPADWVFKQHRRSELLTDYEQGGVALGDASQGLFVRLWRAWLVGDDVMVAPNDDLPSAVVVFSRPGITELSLAFDQLMRPFIAFTDATGSHYWWYDPVLIAQVFVTLPVGSVNVRATLDDGRVLASSWSDIIIGYLRNENLYFRQQRDRFATEYTLAEDMGPSQLINVGMNVGNRLQFQLKSTYVQPVPPPYTPPAGHPFWRVNATAANSHLSIKEIEMAETVGGPDLTTGGTVIASGSWPSNPAVHAATNAFDGQHTDANTWASNAPQSGWIGYEFPVPVDIGEVRLMPRMEYSQYPTAFTIEHSDNGVDWTVAATYNVPSGWIANTFRSFPVPNP